METYERVRLLRKTLGLTMCDFGRAIGLSQSGLSSLESKTRNVTDKHIKLICAAFPTVSEQWLRTGEGDMFVKSSSDLIDDVCKQYDLDGIAKAMLRAYVELDADSRAVISDYIRAAILEYNADAQTQSDATPQPASEIDIDAEVESYRQELLQEKKAVETSSVSSDTAASDA